MVSIYIPTIIIRHLGTWTPDWGSYHYLIYLCRGFIDGNASLIHPLGRRQLKGLSSDGYNSMAPIQIARNCYAKEISLCAWDTGPFGIQNSGSVPAGKLTVG
jgi:hypothetical protein